MMLLAKILMKDPNYQLRAEDIVNKVKGGYVIKVNGHCLSERYSLCIIFAVRVSPSKAEHGHNVKNKQWSSNS